ncbi:hypothetical protein SCHPADRAFT_430406 [Schizopora paradoxa]|uniref:Uncharacterized protein n=1 Tax=Schizopora paradoxa TaxID=27342 RepID=A0A0H2S5J0_9AGAM|nr:hypothetical protein SCHPADRAFT_430406 [Schizopora paradoxa]
MMQSVECFVVERKNQRCWIALESRRSCACECIGAYHNVNIALNISAVKDLCMRRELAFYPLSQSRRTIGRQWLRSLQAVRATKFIVVLRKMIVREHSSAVRSSKNTASTYYKISDGDPMDPILLSLKLATVQFSTTLVALVRGGSSIYHQRRLCIAPKRVSQ